VIALFNNTNFQVVMMLHFACEALDCSIRHPAWTAYAMIACSAYWMFRVWGGLRERSEP
jgi:hypothetical protein